MPSFSSPLPLSYSAAWARCRARLWERCLLVSLKVYPGSFSVSRSDRSGFFSSLLSCSWCAQVACSELVHEGFLSDRCSTRGPGGSAVGRALERHAQFPRGGAHDRAGRAGLEHSRRLRRTIFVRPRSLFWD